MTAPRVLSQHEVSELRYTVANPFRGIVGRPGRPLMFRSPSTAALWAEDEADLCGRRGPWRVLVVLPDGTVVR